MAQAKPGLTTVFPLDAFYRDLSHLTPPERARVNFDDPASLDDAEAFEGLQELIAGRPAFIPEYDFAAHTRTGRFTRRDPAPFILVEGLFAIHWTRILRLCELSIYVDAPDEVCLARRLERDVRERGRTPESIRAQYDTSVRPMASQYIWPSRGHAGLVLNGQDAMDALAARVWKMLLEAKPRNERGLHASV